MNYRLPLLFSIVCFILLWGVTLLRLNFFYTLPLETIIYSSLTSGMKQLTFFWFILLLSCIFFNQQKLYLLTTKNYQLTIILAIVLKAILYPTEFLIRSFAVNLTKSILLKYLAIFELYQDHPMFFPFIFRMESLFNFFALLLINGLIFYVLIALSKRFFDIPTIENSQTFQSQQIVNQDTAYPKTEKALPKLYAMIFSALFCAVTHGITWNICASFIFLFNLPTISYEHYLLVHVVSFIVMLVNFVVIYTAGQKVIVRTYQWLPTRSLLSAGAFAIVGYILITIIISIVLPTLLDISKSSLLILIWFIGLHYFALYLISRFFLKRSFG